MPKFKDIPRFDPPNYSCHVGWGYLEKQLQSWEEMIGIELEPEFQRGHVWTPEQQIAYIEFCLMGGISGSDIYWNCKGWARVDLGEKIQLVDGLQRITAVQGFLQDKIPIFGHRFSEFTDKFDWMRHRFVFHVNELETQADVLRWYLALNTGGTIHTPEEIARVTELLKRYE